MGNTPEEQERDDEHVHDELEILRAHGLDQRADRFPVPPPTPRYVDLIPPRSVCKIWNGPPPPGGAKDKQWYKIQNLGGNAADVWIYDEIGGWGVTAQNLVAELAALNVSDITVHLNSPGGDVFDGIAIMNALRDHPAHVTVKVDALAASIASVIAQAGNTVVMGRNSMMMIHNASGYAGGEAADLRKMADLLDSTTANIASIYAERAGGKALDWLNIMAAETWYSADEAVAAGLADEVAPLPTERDAHRQAAKFDLSNFAHAPQLPDVEPFVIPIPEAPEYRPDLGDTVQVVWNADLFRTAVAEAVPQPVTWDPDAFRTAVALVTNNAPAAERPPAPEPVVATGFDPNLFAAAMREARKQ